MLEKVYHWSKPDIAARLAPLLGLAGVEVWEAPVLRQALAHYGSLNIDFIDAYQGEAALAEGATVIYSYDKDLDRIPGLERREP